MQHLFEVFQCKHSHWNILWQLEGAELTPIDPDFCVQLVTYAMIHEESKCLNLAHSFFNFML